jgi:serine/threonine protein kinase
MAPEQKRGEPVDQRADVFAIGTMLWELCVLQDAPPTEAHGHRMLRRAGIDQDLATIIDKALDPDPERRYPDAGALASEVVHTCRVGRDVAFASWSSSAFRRSLAAMKGSTVARGLGSS